MRGAWVRRVRQLALVWLLLALIAVPTLGHLHQVLHAQALDATRAGGLGHRHGTASALPAPPAVGALSLWELMPGHAAADCLALDQLTLGDAVGTTPWVLPPSLPAQPCAPAHGAGRAAQHVALFEARAPPPV